MSLNNHRNGSPPLSKLEEFQQIWEPVLRHPLREFDPSRNDNWYQATLPTAAQRAELYKSGIDDDTIEAAKLFNVPYARLSARLLNNKSQCRNRGNALFYPYPDRHGKCVYLKAKFALPGDQADPPKYVGPKGCKNAPTLYLPCDTWQKVLNRPLFMILTEGEKKALRAWMLGYVVASLNGVWGGQRPGSHGKALMQALEQVLEYCKTFFIIFDSDAVENDKVLQAEKQLIKLLQRAGCTVVVIRLEPGPNGEKVGLDDFLAQEGGKAKLDAMIAAALAGPMKLPHHTCKEPLEHAQGFIDAHEHPITYGYGSRYWEYPPGTKPWVELTQEKLEIRLTRYLTERYSGVIPATVGKVKGLLPHLLLEDESHFDAEPPFWIGEPRFDLAGKVFTQSDIIDPLTGETYPIGRDIFYTSSINTKYDPNALCPRWLRVLEDMLPGDEESKKVLQEWFGYVMTLGNSLQKVGLILGPAGCGKGTIVRLLEALLGKESVAATSMKALGDSHGLEDLVGKSLATINEIRVNSRTDVNEALNQLLSISGGDAVRINPKGIKGYTLRLSVRFLLTTNEIPSLTDAAGAMDRRLVALRMRHKPAKVDPDLDAKLREELPGIVNWGMVGRRRLFGDNKGQFTEIPRRDDEMSLAELIVEAGALIQTFVGERCVLGDELTVTVPDLYLSYRSWCEAVGEKPRSQKKMGTEIIAAFPQVKATRPDSDGERPRPRGLKGITLKNDGEKRPPHVPTN